MVDNHIQLHLSLIANCVGPERYNMVLHDKVIRKTGSFESILMNRDLTDFQQHKIRMLRPDVVTYIAGIGAVRHNLHSLVSGSILLAYINAKTSLNSCIIDIDKWICI